MLLQIVLSRRRRQKTRMLIKPSDKTLQALLEGGFYKIPRFQRPYSWDQENVDVFLERCNREYGPGLLHRFLCPLSRDRGVGFHDGRGRPAAAYNGHNPACCY